jgi:hypothetical protein
MLQTTDSRRKAYRSLRQVSAVLAIVAAAACGGEDVFTEMSDSTFIQTMVDLRKLPIGDSIDVAARNRQRDLILRRHGVTAAQVESTAVRLANDPALASDIWRAIENPSPVRRPAQKKNGA